MDGACRTRGRDYKVRIVLAGNPEQRRELRRCGRSFSDNIKIDLTRMTSEYVYRIHLSQDKDGLF